jgi:hypothetical protein
MSQDALDLLLSAVKDPGQRKPITSAYYAFANGDAETFAVQFAVLLQAHALSLKALPARLQKVIATETNRMSDLTLAHQVSVRPRKEAVSANGVGDSLETLKKIQSEIQRELAAHCQLLKTEREDDVGGHCKRASPKETGRAPDSACPKHQLCCRRSHRFGPQASAAGDAFLFFYCIGAGVITALLLRANCAADWAILEIAAAMRRCRVRYSAV